MAGEVRKKEWQVLKKLEKKGRKRNEIKGASYLMRDQENERMKERKNK